MIFVHLASDLDIVGISRVDGFLISIKGCLSIMISSQLLAELSNYVLSSTSSLRTEAVEEILLALFTLYYKEEREDPKENALASQKLQNFIMLGQ